MKGISPLIGAVMLISIIIVLGAMLGPWIIKLAQESVNNSGNDVDREIYCRDMSYDFYGSGLEWDFSGSDYLRAEIKNYGTVDVYGFSFEVELSDFSVKRFNATASSQKSEIRPLRPGESAVIEANLTEDINASLDKVSLRNGMGCNPLSKEV